MKKLFILPQMTYNSVRSLVFIGLLLTSNISFSQSDNCATATVINLDASGQACVTGTTVNATSSNTFYGTCNPSTTANEVWYTYVTNGSVNVFDVIPNGLSNPEIVIFTAGCSGILETCNTQTGTGTMNTSWGLPVGTQVWIGVMSNGGTEGGFDLCINSTAPDPSGGNTCGGAIPLCDKFNNFTLDMSTITPSGDWPDCFGASMNNDVWFTFTATQAGTLEFQVTPTGAGAGGVELDWAVYDITALGGCPNLPGFFSDPSLSCNYNYDGENGAPAGMTNPAGGEFNAPVNIIAGNTYAIVVDYYSGGGTGTMDFEFLPGMTAEIAPVVDFTVSPSITCGTSMNVAITDNSYGGVPTWDFGDGSPTYTGTNPPAHNYTTPGTYVISSTIAGVCNSTHTEFVQLFGPLATAPTATLETCPGDCDASISLATTGGSGQYSYSWSPGGETTPSISNICSGNYSVTITDDVCGNLVENINVVDPPSCASCIMDSMPIIMTNCYSTPSLAYDVSGNLYFTDAPSTGTLTITDCQGNTEVLNAPFTSPTSFSFTGLPQTGTNCTFTAVFSDDPACTITTNFLAPPPITGFTITQNNCANDTFQLSGTVSFINPPATGTLTISYNDGVSTIDTVINAPFTSPENWSLAAPANGNNYTITVYFSGYPTCAVTYNGTAEPPCDCLADIGTFSTTITPNNGQSQSPYILCYGDEFTMTSNGDFTPPDDVGNAPPNYNPGIGYLIYSCPPTIAVTPSNTAPNDNIANDPCFVGIVGFGNSFDDTNLLGSPSYAGTWTNNTVYYIPITFYDTLGNPATYSYALVGNLPCYEMGPTFAVQYLTEITTTTVEDCQDSSVTVTINGGLPELDGSSYTASNLQPANANFVNTATTHGGTIIINGLLDGDMYSFDIVDNNGCPVTITGGPFVGLPNANAGIDDTSCTLTYNLTPTASFGTGTWTGPAGVNFTPNANTANATVTVTTAGTYTFTWTEDNGGGCVSSDDVTIRFNQLSIPETPTDPTCHGGNDGQIILAPQGGTPPYSYQWDAAANNQTTNPATGLGAGSYTVTVTDDFGCSVDSTFTLTEPVGFSYTTDSQNANCNNPDGWATVVNFSGGTAGYTYDWGAGPANNDTLFNLSPNTYSVTVADINGCDTTFSITVGNTPGFTASITASTNASCNGVADGSATVNGSDPTATYNFSWNTTPTQNTQTASGLSAGNYIVTVTDINTGCIDTASITITEPDSVTITSTDVTICSGQSATLTATAGGGSGSGYTYNWNNGASATSTYSVTPPATTSYPVFATDGNGCVSSTINVTVTVTPPLSVVASPSDTSICPGQSVTIYATPFFGNGGPYTYQWSNGLTDSSQVVSPTTTTVYTVTLDDGCSTPTTGTVTINIMPLPQVSFTADKFEACETPLENFEFYNTTDTTGGMVGTSIWDFGDGSSTIGDTVTHIYNSAGTYDVTLTITSTAAAGGCTNSLTYPNYITIHQNPTADFYMNDNPANMLNPTVNFIDQSYFNIVNWAWDIGGFDSSYIPNPTYEFPIDTGHYPITLTVIDENGCMGMVTKILEVEGEFGIYIPNAFTPDFDFLNEGFGPKGFGISQENYSFYIFDRWGEMIFESHTLFEQWDGTYKSKFVQNGVYVWKLEFQDINGKKHSKIGHVNVIK